MSQMKYRWATAVLCTGLMCLGATGATLTVQSDEPVVEGATIAQLKTPASDAENINGTVNGAPVTYSGTNDASTYVANDRSTQGQIFTTGSYSKGYVLTDLWVKHVLYTTYINNGSYATLSAGNVVTVRIVDPAQAGSAGFVLSSEVATVTAASTAISVSGGAGTGLWLHIVLDKPVNLAANTQYGFDLTSYGPYFELAGVYTDEYTDGAAYTCANKEDLNTGTVRDGDRTFVIPFSVQGQATSPTPADKAEDVNRKTSLTWKPGSDAASHSIYFGADRAAVQAGDASVQLSSGQDANSYTPGPLQFGQTYYWRVDELLTDGSTVDGATWTFTVEPVSVAITAGVTAEADSSFDTSSVASKTVDGSGLDATTDTHGTTASDMWISGMTPFPHWIQYSFDKVYKLNQMEVWNSNQTLEGLFGLGAKDVLVQVSTDGTTWADVGNFVFTKAPGNATCAADTKVPFNGAAAKYVKLTITSNWGGFFTQASLSEVRFYSIPVTAAEPSPTPGSVSLHPQVAMSWRAGRDVASHEVHIGTDPNAVAASTTPTATVDQAKYDAALALGQTYYWKVVEVNQATNPTSWPSPVWSFSTATFINFDDFQSYTNNSPRRVFQTWIDGSGFSPDDFFPNGNSGNGTGSLVGYDPTLGDIMETAYTNTGNQAMPLFYDNSASPKISEAIRTLDPAKDTTDWTKYGLTTLVLFFHGSADNGAAPVYVKINNTKKVYGTAAATTITYWRQWNIDLASIPAADLKNVKTITIGVGDGSAGGSGKIIVDDIRLYATAPAVAVPTDPGTTGLEALYAMEGDAKDSSGKGRDGTLNGEPSFVDGPAGMGKALAFDGTNDFVDLPIGNLISTLGGSTFAARVNFTGGSGGWQRVFDFGLPPASGNPNTYVFMTPRQGTTGSTRTAIRTAAISEQGANGPVTLPTDGWHHMATVFDDAVTPMRVRLFVDGVQVGNGTTRLLPKDLGVTTQNWLGRSQWSGDAYLSGSLDDFRIYSRPLSDGEIKYLAGDR